MGGLLTGWGAGRTFNQKWRFKIPFFFVPRNSPFIRIYFFIPSSIFGNVWFFLAALPFVRDTCSSALFDCDTPVFLSFCDCFVLYVLHVCIAFVWECLYCFVWECLYCFVWECLYCFVWECLYCFVWECLYCFVWECLYCFVWECLYCFVWECLYCFVWECLYCFVWECLYCFVWEYCFFFYVSV